MQRFKELTDELNKVNKDLFQKSEALQKRVKILEHKLGAQSSELEKAQQASEG